MYATCVWTCARWRPISEESYSIIFRRVFSGHSQIHWLFRSLPVLNVAGLTTRHTSPGCMIFLSMSIYITNFGKVVAKDGSHSIPYDMIAMIGLDLPTLGPIRPLQWTWPQHKPSGVDWTWLNTTGNSLGTLAQNTSAFSPFTTSHFHFACNILVFWTVLHCKFRWLTGTISLRAQGDWTSRGSDPDPSKLFFMSCQVWNRFRDNPGRHELLADCYQAAGLTQKTFKNVNYLASTYPHFKQRRKQSN